MVDPRDLLSKSWAYNAFRRLVVGSTNPERLARDYLKILPGQRVLDIGCGPGDILKTLPSDIDYHGFDYEPDYIASAKKRYGHRGSFRVRAIAPDAVEDIGTFDTVISIGVLHHLAEEEADTLVASARKVLRPGGRLVTLDGVYVAGQNPIAKLLLKLDRGRHVRSADAYVEIARRHFDNVEATVLHDLIAIPYTHIVMEAASPAK